MGMLKALALMVVLAAFAATLAGVGTASATLLCTAEPVEEEGALKCPEPKKNQYGVDFVPGSHIGGTLTGNATFESTEGTPGTVTCTESTLTAALTTIGTSKEGEGITETLFSSNAGKPCSSTFSKNPEASVTAENLSYDATVAEYEGVGSPQGNLTVKKSGGSSVQIKIVLLSTPSTCLYQPSEALTGNWVNGKKGGAQSQLTFTAQKFTKTGGALVCPTKARFSATYNLKALLENTEIYIAKE